MHGLKKQQLFTSGMNERLEAARAKQEIEGKTIETRTAK
jgi:hypothetical protein